jgi:hypothetical protein
MKAIEAAAARAMERAPSVVVLDDVDLIVPAVAAPGQGEVAGAGDAVRHRAQTLLLVDVLRELRISRRQVGGGRERMCTGVWGW